jgi:hypothetical protein
MIALVHTLHPQVRGASGNLRGGFGRDPNDERVDIRRQPQADQSCRCLIIQSA